jgi:hypothetical protein
MIDYVGDMMKPYQNGVDRIQGGGLHRCATYNKINIKKLQSTLKKVVIGRAVTALKQQKSKGKGEEKGIAEVVHLMKPITRSPIV